MQKEIAGDPEGNENWRPKEKFRFSRRKGPQWGKLRIQIEDDEGLSPGTKPTPYN